eukprot:Em0199g3a
MLPFGLRSAPKIFNALADSLEWIIRRKGVAYTAHYLDDYVIAGPPGTSRCADDLHTLVETCKELRVPLAVAKCEGPTPCLTFLGIQIDTVNGTLSLPKEKLERVQSMVQQWEGRKACSRRELESLIGLLNHACKVVRPGRSFLRRMLDLLSSSAGRGSHRGRGGFVRLNRAFQADLAWWRAFLQEWNGVGFMSAWAQSPAMVELVSDASGSWGCGAFWGSRWLQVQWDESAVCLPIAAKELLPIILGSAIWGAQWKGLVVTCRCENQAVVSTLLSRTSREEHMMHMLRCLFYIEAAFDFQLRCHHIPGVLNTAADALSRNNADLFFAQVPLANPTPDNPPDQPGRRRSFLFQEGPRRVNPSRTYAAGMKRFNQFCNTFALTSPFPVSESTLCYFAVYLAKDNLASQTIKTYLAAVRDAQIALGMPEPRCQSSLPRLDRIQAGIRRVQAQKGTPPKARLPITPMLLRRLRDHWGSGESGHNEVLWAVACICFFGFFRLGELLNIPGDG